MLNLSVKKLKAIARIKGIKAIEACLKIDY